MNKTETFNEFLVSDAVQIPIIDFVINLILAGLLSFLLTKLYIKCGRSLSNRVSFGENFMLLTMTTMLIISIVKSSLALSLGLVGALSIVRFRAAIKEPEELAYLFLAIGMGLGLGADQRISTIIAFLIIASFLYMRNKYLNLNVIDDNLYLTINSDSSNISANDIIGILKENCEEVTLKRFSESGNDLEASFKVRFKTFSDLEKSKESIQSIDKSAKFVIIESNGLF